MDCAGAGGYCQFAAADVLFPFGAGGIGDCVGDQLAAVGLRGDCLKLLLEGFHYGGLDASGLDVNVETEGQAEFAGESESGGGFYGGGEVIGLDMLDLLGLDFGERTEGREHGMPGLGEGSTFEGVLVGPFFLSEAGAADEGEEFFGAVAEGLLDELGMSVIDGFDDALHFACGHGETDDAPGEKSAVEVSNGQAEAVTFKGGGELQGTLAGGGNGTLHETLPGGFVDRSG